MPDFKSVLKSLEFEANPRQTKKARSSLLNETGWELPAELEQFYDIADGGELPHLQCRFLPLEEALEYAGIFAEIESYRGLPIFESHNASSDPCLIMIGGPFPGAIYQHHHDLDRRVFAPGVYSFLQHLAKLPEEWINLEEQNFVYPKKLNQKEQRIVKKLLELSQTDLQDEYEPQLLVGLALSMLRDEDVSEYFTGWEHPNHHARHEIEYRLKNIGSTESQSIVNKSADNQQEFVKQALKVLKQAGFTASSSTGLNIYVKEGDSHLNVEMFYDRRNKPDCWDYLLERVRFFASME